MASLHTPSIFEPLLQPKSIRLLQLVRSATLSESSNLVDICFVLRQFDLDSCPEYSALSYTWGDACREESEYTEDEEQPSPSELATILFLGEPQVWEESHLLDFLKDSREHATPFLITRNLYDGLQQLANSGQTRRWLWIDAICIDQGNDDEKAVQVALMGDIYSSASKVIIWLGSDTSDWPEFAWLCTHFLIAISDYCIKFSIEDLKAQKLYNRKFFDHSKLDIPTGDIATCFERYFQFCRRRRWFSRIWIVQETVLARDIVVLCGASSLPWQNLDILADMMKTFGWQSLVAPNVTNDAFGRAIGDETLRLSLIRGYTQGKRESDDYYASEFGHLNWYESMMELLHQTRPYSATDPRDKIFGVLGIAKTAWSEDLPMPINPDYSDTSTVARVYISVATILLKNVPRLANLSFLEDPGSRRIKNLPSWTPDYSSTFSPSPLVHGRNEEHSFNCSPQSSSSEPSFQITGHTLKLQAALFDSVVELGPSFWDIIFSSKIQVCLEVCRNIAQPYLDINQDPSEVLLRTLIADTYESVHKTKSSLISLPAPWSILTAGKVWACNRLATILTPDILSVDEQGAQVSNAELDEPHIRSQLSFLQDLQDLLPSFNSLPTVLEVLTTVRLMHRFKLQNFSAQFVTLDPDNPFPTKSEQINRIEGESAPYHTAIGFAAPFRRTFRTERGFLGLGPQSMTVGDGVWLVKDAKVPFVLRDSEDEKGIMNMIGECYLHGWMNGRMAEEVGARLQNVSIV